MAEYITILDAAKARGLKEDDDGAISMGVVEDLGLPFFAGCARCGASLCCYNAYPSRTGFTHCEDCIGPNGFKTAEEFERFEALSNEEEDGTPSDVDPVEDAIGPEPEDYE
mgnify:CR=1 FL=1